MLGNKNSIKSLHTQCGKKNKSESCYVKKELPSWAKKRAACKDTPGFVNGNAHDRLSLPAAGHGCDAYAKRWCANGKARPGQQWALGKKYRYPERNCCVCGKRGLQPGWVQKSVRAAAAKKKALKAAAEKAEKAEKAAVEKAAAYASQAAAKKKTAFHTAYASAAAKT